MQRVLSIAGVVLLVAVACLLTASARGEPVDARSVSPTEVAVLSGYLSHGATLPVPVYADGTEATESECKWIISTHKATGLANGSIRKFECYTTSAWPPGVVATVTDVSGVTLYGVANYIIIATRAESPSSVKPLSWGGLKATFR